MFLKVLLLFLVLDVGLRIRGVETVYRLVTRHAARHSAAQPSAADGAVVEAVARALARATRYYYRRRRDCLPKAMSLFYLLRRQGVPVELCWGVKKYPFGGHTWVEYQGQPIAENPVEIAKFQVLTRAR